MCITSYHKIDHPINDRRATVSMDAFRYIPAKPVLQALPVLLLMESSSPAGDFGNVNKYIYKYC